MKKLLLLISMLLSFSVFADSTYIDSEWMRNCGGTIQLRSKGTNYYLNLKNTDTGKCPYIAIRNASGSQTYKQYTIPVSGTASYTLSDKLIKGSSKIKVQVYGNGFKGDSYTVTLKSSLPYLNKTSTCSCGGSIAITNGPNLVVELPRCSNVEVGGYEYKLENGRKESISLQKRELADKLDRYGYLNVKAASNSGKTSCSWTIRK